MSKFEETVDILIEQMKDEASELPSKTKLDLIFIGGLAEHLENKASYLRTVGFKCYTFEDLMVHLGNSLKEIEELYKKKRKELKL